jgi:hypothetical protein
MAPVTSGFLTLLSFFLFYKELDTLSIHMYVKWHHAWGRRVERPGRSFNGPAIDMSGLNGAITQEQYEGVHLRAY